MTVKKLKALLEECDDEQEITVHVYDASTAHCNVGLEVREGIIHFDS